MAHFEPCVKWVKKVKEMRGKLVILRRRHHLLHFYFLLAWFLDGSGWSVSFRERKSGFSLRSRAIGPSDFDGARREAVLRGEDNAWTPVLGVFDKFREVGVSSYLFYSCFKCFVNVWVGLRP